MDAASLATSLLSAALVGLLGSLHCVGMCGGIVGALSFGLAPGQGQGRRLGLLLAYNLGRILSYSLAGVLLGALGAGLAGGLGDLQTAARFGRVLSATFMIALGLYLAGWTPVLAPLERAGSRLWRHIEPLGRRLLPVQRGGQALALGLVWGWLPCGMVYSVLVLALSSASPLSGGAIMLAFGLGTLPMLLSLGGAAGYLVRAARSPRIRRLAGGLIVLFGVLGLLAPLGDWLPRHGDAARHATMLEDRRARPAASGFRHAGLQLVESNHHDGVPEHCAGLGVGPDADGQDRAAGLRHTPQPEDRPATARRTLAQGRGAAAAQDAGLPSA